MSQKPIINGKHAVSTKSDNPEQDFKFSFGNLLDVPANIRAELKAQGLACRWINKAAFINNGSHASHWVPYQTKNTGNTFGFGVSPEGHIQRADLILGVRPLQMHNAHKSFLDERNLRMKGYNAQAIKELKQQVGDKKGVKITSGDAFEGEE